jgi:hypothetical protein
MNWLDHSLRDEFERGDRLRKEASPENVKTAASLDRLLPNTIKQQSLAIGNELILSYHHALTVIEVATENAIAILGFDAGEVAEGGFRIVGYSGYDAGISFNGDWASYVSSNNVEAKLWLQAHHLGRNHGYIVTSTSQEELSEARERIGHQ